MKRLRGRRVALFIASALPLLAEEDSSSRLATGEVLSRQDWGERSCHATSSSASVVDTCDKEENPLSPSLFAQPQQEQQQHSPYDRYSSIHTKPPYRPSYWSELPWMIRSDGNQSVFPFHSYPWEDDGLVIPYRDASRQPRDYVSVGNTSMKDSKGSSTEEAKIDESEGSTEGGVGSSEDQPEEQMEVDVESTKEESEEAKVQNETKAKIEPDENVKHVAVDYADKSVGALILDSSENFQGASNLLQKDRDKYAIVPCAEPTKYVVIGLSEDILVKQVVLANYERYSSHMKEIHLSGSATTAIGKSWMDLGSFTTTASGISGEQSFDLIKPTWARYLKFEFVSHYGDEHYCTVSQIKVHGSTMLQGFHEQWAEEEEEEQKEDVSVDEIEASDDAKTFAFDDGADKIDTDESLSNTLRQEIREEDLQDDIDSDDSNEGLSLRELSPLDRCVSMSNGVCPNDWNFETKMFSFMSGNLSEINRMGALSCASMSLSASLQLTSNTSLSTASLHPNQHRSFRGIVRQTREVGSRSLLVADASQKEESSKTLADPSATRSSMAERIKHAIRTTAGTVVHLEEIGSNMLRSKPDKTEGDVAMSESSSVEPALPSNSVAVTSESSNNKKIYESSDSTSASADMESPQIPTKMPKDVEHADADGAPKSEAKKHAHVGVEDLHEAGVAIAKVLKRLPSAKCLEKLDFTAFKAELLKTRSGGAGASGNGPPGGAMEPIFKKLTDEIKSLQANVAVHDQFAMESIMCYQSVMLEILVEMETLRLSQDARISLIENELQLAAWVVTLQRMFVSLFLALWSCLRLCNSLVSLVVNFVEDNANSATVGMVTGMVLCLLLLVRLASRVAGKRRKAMAKAAPSPPATPLPMNPITTSLDPPTLVDDDTSTPRLSPETTDPIKTSLNLAPKKKKATTSTNGVRLIEAPA